MELKSRAVQPKQTCHKRSIRMTDSEIPDVTYETINTVGHLNLNTYIEKHQPSQLTGSVSVKSRKQRAVEVCLCLLCALLLMAVIALCVYFTIERKHLLTHITNLTKEKDQILQHNNNLTEEREQILKHNLTEEKQQILNKYEQLLKHNNNLTEEKEQIRKKFDELQHGFYVQDQRADNFKWIYFNFSFYYISSVKKSWSDSRLDCQQRGADLAIIKSREEKEFLQKAAVSGPLWIDLTKTDVVGVWKGTTVSDLNFHLLSLSGYNYYCAVMSSSAWSPGFCRDSSYWICKRTVF